MGERSGWRGHRLRSVLLGVVAGIAATTAAFLLPSGWTVADRAHVVLGWSEQVTLSAEGGDACHPRASGLGTDWIGRTEGPYEAPYQDTGRLRRTSKDEATYRSEDGWTTRLFRKGLAFIPECPIS